MTDNLRTTKTGFATTGKVMALAFRLPVGMSQFGFGTQMRRWQWQLLIAGMGSRWIFATISGIGMNTQ